MYFLLKLGRASRRVAHPFVVTLMLTLTAGCNIPSPSEQAMLQTMMSGGDSAEGSSDDALAVRDLTDLASNEVLARYLSTTQAAPVPSCVFPRRGQYREGTLFPSHRSQGTLDQDVVLAYERWKSRYLVKVAQDESLGPQYYRVSFGIEDPSRTVSEGQAYGMLLAVLLAGYDPEAQVVFDGLLRYSEAHPSDMDYRFMAWTVPNEGTAAAFDAEVDIAFALMLADATWGSGTVIDYEVAAKQRIEGMMARMIGPDSLLPMLGDWVEPWGADYDQYSPRSSDLIAFYFRSFSRYTGDRRWDHVATASTEVISRFQVTNAQSSALLPDFLRVSQGALGVSPAEPGFLEGEHDGHYYYNAGRLPWRVGLDALLEGDKQSVTQLARFAAFARGEMSVLGASGLRGGYRLDGTPIDDYFSTFFAAPLAISLMGDSGAQQQLNELYDAVYDAEEDYYQDSVSLLSLIVLTGNFWDPTREGCVSRAN